MSIGSSLLTYSKCFRNVAELVMSLPTNVLGFCCCCCLMWAIHSGVAFVVLQPEKDHWYTHCVLSLGTFFFFFFCFCFSVSCFCSVLRKPCGSVPSNGRPEMTLDFPWHFKDGWLFRHFQKRQVLPSDLSLCERLLSQMSQNLSVHFPLCLFWKTTSKNLGAGNVWLNWWPWSPICSAHDIVMSRHPSCVSERLTSEVLVKGSGS